MELNIRDVRAQMPNYENYKDWQREGDILGIAIHHSATADRVNGAPVGDAFTFFNYQVHTRGWAHGGYNYVIPGNGEIQYALDEKIAAYHAGFKDPDDSEGLESGQYWNNHYLAICVAGWFNLSRTYVDSNGQTHPIPNNYISPTIAQQESLIPLIQQLRRKYNIPVENVRGHRELHGNSTSCPGGNFNPAELREKLRAEDEASQEPLPDSYPDPLPEVEPGEHVLILPDTDRYLDISLAYVWKFLPDVTFALEEARGRWDYITVVGDTDVVSDSQMAYLWGGGAKLVQRIAGDPTSVQAILDDLVQKEVRFLSAPPDDGPEPEPEPWQTYIVQPGDTLSAIARQIYGRASLWSLIFEANRDILSDPGSISPGQTLKIPPAPDA